MSEPAYLHHTRDGYDRAATAFAPWFETYLHERPLDRAVLTGFCELVGAGGTLADIGCGTGMTTEIFSRHGLDAFGIDLSPNMIAEARSRHPGLAFRVGSMLHLDIADHGVDAVCAWYSIIHVPDDDLGRVFTEFHRILVPGGHLLLGFQVGTQPSALDEAFGHQVRLTFHRRQPDAVQTQLDRHGFDTYAQTVRSAADDESTPQAFLIARKRTAP